MVKIKMAIEGLLGSLVKRIFFIRLLFYQLYFMNQSWTIMNKTLIFFIREFLYDEYVELLRISLPFV